MDFILIAYVGVMAIGLLWVLYRVVLFIRSQREMDRRWGGETPEAEFTAFIEEFKRNNLKKEMGQDPERERQIQEASGNGIAPSPTVSTPRSLDTD